MEDSFSYSIIETFLLQCNYSKRTRFFWRKTQHGIYLGNVASCFLCQLCSYIRFITKPSIFSY